MEKIFSITKAGYQISLQANLIGNDLLLSIIGGDHPHIGTVTIVEEAGEKKTLRFPSHSGRFHKDDRLAEIILEQLGGQLNGNCVITAGVHVDHISKEQIEAASLMTRELSNQLLSWLKEQPVKPQPSYYAANESPPAENLLK